MIGIILIYCRWIGSFGIWVGVGFDSGEVLGLGVYSGRFWEVGEMGTLFSSDLGLAFKVAFCLGWGLTADVESYASDCHLVKVEIEFVVLLLAGNDGSCVDKSGSLQMKIIYFEGVDLENYILFGCKLSY